MDEYCGVPAEISRECHQEPEVIKGTPHNGPTHRVKHPEINDEELIAVTWRQYLKKKGLKKQP
ncbi:hypothetical protein [Syntrophomonas curvata]